MAPDATSPLMYIEQFALVIFILMILVGMVGGRPETVLKPVFDITANIIMAVIGLISQLTATLFGGIVSLVLTGVKDCSNSRSNSSRQINR